MSKSAITNAFTGWLADCMADNKPARPDKMIFAYIAGQNESAEIDPDEALPPASAIRHTADIAQYGTLNERSFVCSVILDPTVGDWSYNWIGLLDSETSTLLMIVHHATQQKLRTKNGEQGNTLTRNLVMDFSGAAAASQINVTAQTWQIDYSARLVSMDESRRMFRVDYFGDAAFRGDGFLVSLSGNDATVSPGLGYVGGLRVGLEQDLKLSVSGNTAVWVDVTWSGTVTGAWSHKFSVRAASALSDYTDEAGFRHFVTKIASVSGGKITDHREPFPVQRLEVALDDLDFYDRIESDRRFLQVNNNLDDVSDTAVARKNLGLKGAAVLDVGKGASTVAAGDDSRITGALQKTSNLSDIADKTEARKNLGLKGAAVLDVGKGANTVAAGDDSRITGALQKTSNLSDVADKTEARKNLGLKGAAVLDVGKGANTVAAGDDSRITGALQKTSNLSDIADKTEARKNLGLGADGEGFRLIVDSILYVGLTIQSETNPQTRFTWQKWADQSALYAGRVMRIGAESGVIGGKNQVKLDADHLPPHWHRSGDRSPGVTWDPTTTHGTDNQKSGPLSMTEGTYIDASGTEEASNTSLDVTNEYVTVRMWKRTA